MSERLIEFPTIPDYKWWVDETDEESSRDKLEQAKELIYLHKVGVKYEFVLLYKLRGQVIQEKFKHDPGNEIDHEKLFKWLNNWSVFSEREAEVLFKHAMHVNRLNNVVNCYDTDSWLVKEDLSEETTYWNEYIHGKFIWDPREFGTRKLSAPIKAEEVLYGFIKRQCSDNDQLAQHFLKCLARKFKDPFCLMGNIFVFSGEEGTGKSLLLDLVANCFGKTFATRTEQLDEQFSAAFNPYAVSVIHEATQLSDKKHGLLRDRATNEEIKINVKYEIQRNYRNFTWFLMATNPSSVTRAHFLVKGQGRRYRFLTSKAEPAVFRPWLLEHGMFHPRGQGFADEIKDVLVTLAERYYDPSFIPGAKSEAVEFSCPEARAIHLTERPYEAKVGGDEMKRVILQQMKANGGKDLKDGEFKIEDIREMFGIEDSPTINRSIGWVLRNTRGFTKLHSSYNHTIYRIDADEARKWLSEMVLENNVYDHRTYMAWSNMKARCYNPNHASFKHYGAKGVTVCDRWKDSYQNFIEDMGTKPEGGRNVQLGRKNDQGNYEPGNVTWEVKDENSATDA